MKKPKFVGQIVEAYLREHGYDGLVGCFDYDETCGCLLDDLVPCGEDFSDDSRAIRYP
jgi:hypothetical protein